MLNRLLNSLGPNNNYDFAGTGLEFYEASTLMLLGAGLVGLFICNRKRVNFA
jgi:hypothetical protein